MMTARTGKGPTLKWMGLLALFTVLPPIIAGLSIVQIYHEDLKGSFIAIEGIVLIAGILFSFFLTRNFNLPHKRSSKEKEQELVQRTRELEVFYEIGVLINEHLGNLDAVLPISLEKVTSLTGYEMGAIFLLGGAGDVLEMKSQIGHSPAMLQEVKVLKFSEGVSGRAIRLKQPVIVSISEYPSRRIAPVLREEGIQTVVGIPLLAKGNAIGAIILSSRSPHQLGHREVNSLESIGSQIGLALENSVLLNEIGESEEKYRTVVERAIDGVCVIGRDYLFSYVNERLAEIQGYRREELIGTDFRNLLDEESRTLLADREDKRARGIKSPSHFELNVLQKDGGIRNAEISASAVKDSKGDVNIIVLLKDITDRKRAEEALRQSEEKYRTILENIQEAYYEMNLAGNFTFVNDTICRHLGYSREELIGMNYRQYQDETTAEKMYQRYKKVYETGKPIEILDAELVRKDGTKGIYEMSVSLIRDSEGKPVGFRGVSREVTERKQMERALRQSEEKYRTILESIEDGYYEVDLAGKFTFFNDSMCRILGYPKEALMGMNNRQYTDKEVAEKVFQAFSRVYKTGKPGRGFEWEIVRKDGTKRYIETSVSLRKDASGEPVGFRGIVRDVTDRKRIEEQLFQAEKLRAVGEMASGVAHDFNNALAAILGNTQLLLYTAQDEELKETLKIIERVAKDSGQTVRRLQDFTRKPVRQELFKVDINSIIKDSIEITKPKWKDEAQSRGIRIEMVSNLEEIPFMSGNASELREVITNMIFNAIEAMHEGGKVEIRTFKKRRDIFIQISDTGIGIAEEAKKRIFEPFFTTKPFSNTGLGLSMSYGIVKRFGGEIEVESKVGQGTTFTIILPIGEEEKEEAVDPQTIKKGRKARILVIDDEEFVRSVLSRTLAQADHQVTLAEDGRKGVQLFKEGKFDIVLTDLGMPGVSGWEVCRMIKEVSPRTPVGMITGWGDERNRSKMEEYGLDFFISKPFDFAQILNVVAETMESKEE